jgi:hypothetical protein
MDVEAWMNLRVAARNSGYDPGLNGGGLSVGFQDTLIRGFGLCVSIEAGAAGIGNYFSGKAGFRRRIPFPAARMSYTPGLNLVQGMALFRPGVLYMWGVEQTNSLDFLFKGYSGPGLVVGFRYYGFPGYADYSRISAFFDVRMGLRYTF